MANKQANQWFSDPRQELFLAEYTNPKSPLWGNALQSALKAGYSQEYSENITNLMPSWLSEAIGKSKIIEKAEKNLESALDGLLDDPEKGGKQIQWKATEMALRTLKKEEYSERQEVVGKDGKDLIPETLTDEEKKALLALIK
jgi:phage terminase small subunit